MADLTPEAIAELRLLSKAAHPNAALGLRCWQVLALLDAAERCAAYDAKLTAVMPPDFKDWHENDKSEWPETAAWCITNWRERCAAAEAQAKAAGELLIGAVHCDTTYVSGHDTIEVNLDHFDRLCEARNAAIRLLLPAERAGVKT